MTKKVKLGLAVTLACLALISATGCNPGDNNEGTNFQLTEVERGDLTLSATGSGNIETFREARLSFGSGGTVDGILVREGDRVAEGDVMAKLKTSPLELNRKQAQVALNQAKVVLTQAQLAQRTAQYEMKTTRDKKDTLELALLNAEINFDQAKYNLEQTSDLYTWSDIKTAKSDVDDARRYLDDLLDRVGKFLPKDEEGNYPNILEYVFEEDYPKTPGYEYWQEDLIHAQRRLNAAEDRLKAMLSFSDTTEVAIKRRQVEAAEMGVAQARNNLDELNEQIAIKELQVEAAGQSLEQARYSVELAQQSLEEAQRQLDEATIIAPFDGIVAAIGAKEGDLVSSPTVSARTIVHLIDMSTMELVIEVDEIDIPLLKLGQEVDVSLDALPDLALKGKVASIHPLPNQTGGVVVYNVRIELEVPEGAGVRPGMSASADIVIERRSNALLVPTRALQEDGQRNQFVKVMVNGQVQEREVATGISDGLHAEIISGLSEGEAVVIEPRPRPALSGPGAFFGQ